LLGHRSKELADVIDRVSNAAKGLLCDAVVRVFGSVASGDYTPASDVDILITSQNVPRGAMARAELKVALEKQAGLPPINSVEIYLVTPEEAWANPIYREVLSKLR